MSEYGDFAYVYDRLMSDVNYHKRTKYLISLFKKFDAVPKLLLDVACGTGGFSNEFALAGVEVIGTDMSEEMLSVARENSANLGTDVLYLCQRAEELDLYGTVDGAVCCLDSLNHITDYNKLCKALKKIALFLEEERLFIFDVNTVYKHKNILANNTFVIEQEGVYCVWQNEFNSETMITDISLDFFVENENGQYVRTLSEFSERAYSDLQLEKALNEANLEIVDVFADLSFEKPQENTERIFYVTRKKSDK